LDFWKKMFKIISYGKVEYDNKYFCIPKNIMRQILLKNINKIIEHIKKLIKDFS
jgi:flavodoxin